MARYTLSSSQLFFLLILFQAFSLIEAKMNYTEYEFPVPSAGRSKYTVDLISSNEYQIPEPSFNATTGNATTGNVTVGKFNIEIVGPPGEIVIYARGTKVSWDNRTVYTDSFIDQPRIRGTVGILISCIFTLFLCVWTAFHANIEPAREDDGTSWLSKWVPRWVPKRISKWLYSLVYGRWRRKALWSAIIIIFPESPLFFALFEGKKVKKICTEIDKIIRTKKVAEIKGACTEINKACTGTDGACVEIKGACVEIDGACEKISKACTGTDGGIKKAYTEIDGACAEIKGACEKINRACTGTDEEIKKACTEIDKACGRLGAFGRWSTKLQLGYFVLMGGFAREDKQDGGKEKQGRAKKADTLTIDGVYDICQNLDRADKLARIVDDKNGASAIAKCLVLFQVIRIIVQIGCRYKAHLSVTLLETHTVIHGVCALTVYLVWFKKPFDVKYPIELDPQITKGLSSDTKEEIQPRSSTDIEKGPPSTNTTEETPLLVERAGQTRLVLGVLRSKPRKSLSGLPDRILKAYRELELVWWELFVMLLASGAYLGLHIWAWRQGHFPTPWEKHLWGIAVYSTAAGFSIYLLFFISHCVFYTSRFLGSCCGRGRSHRRDKGHGCGGCLVLKWLFLIICVAALIVGAVARLYFVAESFVSMRDPSAKAFRMVSWTNVAL